MCVRNAKWSKIYWQKAPPKINVRFFSFALCVSNVALCCFVGPLCGVCHECLDSWYSTANGQWEAVLCRLYKNFGCRFQCCQSIAKRFNTTFHLTLMAPSSFASVFPVLLYIYFFYMAIFDFLWLLSEFPFSFFLLSTLSPKSEMCLFLFSFILRQRIHLLLIST